MAIRSASQYQSFRRRAGSPGSQSNYAASLIKKQNSAEDDYWDNQYDVGNITAEQYLTILRGRETSRTYYTPLQLQNLKQKIVSVGEDFTDSEVEKMYKEGKIDTTGYTQYFKERLNTMTPDNKAYNTLSIKVKGLEDKAQREARSEYRLNQMVKISQEQGDTSKSYEAKAKLYQELEDQARLDGDTAQADQFLIQKNNAKESARKANINDYLTETRGTSITKYGEAARQAGTAPTSAGSAPLRSQGGTGITSGGARATTTTAPRASSFPTSGGSSKKVLSAMNRINDLETNRAELEYKISRYENAINQATGDQKTSLINTYNSYLNDYAQNTSSLADAQQSLADAQQAAVVGAANKYAKNEKQRMAEIEKKVLSDFKAGLLSKEQFLTASKDVFDEKMQTLQEISDGYSNLGEFDKSENYLKEIEKETPAYEDLNDKINRPDDFQPFRVDKNGDVTDSFGNNLKAGDVGLKDISILRDTGVLNENYAKIGGVYHKLYSSKFAISENEPLGLGDRDAKQYAKDANTLFVYGEGGKKTPVQHVKVKNPKAVKMVNGKENPRYDENEPEYIPMYVTNKKDESTKDEKSDGTTMLERLAKTEGLTGAGVLTYEDKDGVKVPVINTVDPKGKVKAATTNKFIGNIQEINNKLNKVFGIVGGKDQAAYKSQRSEDRKAPIDFNPTSKTFLQPKKKQEKSITPALPAIRSAVKKAKEKSSLLSSIVKPVYADSGSTKPQPTIGPKGSPEMEFERLIIDALDKQGILSEKTLAYAMATAKHEASFQPKSEIMAPVGRDAHNDRIARLQNNYSGGKKYIGRGYVQLTHDYNYKEIGDAIGVDLVNNPEKLLEPKIAADAMAAFFKLKGVSRDAETGDFVLARRHVNGTDKAQEIAATAQNYLGKSQEAIKRYSTAKAQIVKQPKQVAPKKQPNMLDSLLKGIGSSIAKPVSAATVPLRSQIKAPSQPKPKVALNVNPVSKDFLKPQTQVKNPIIKPITSKPEVVKPTQSVAKPQAVERPTVKQSSIKPPVAKVVQSKAPAPVKPKAAPKPKQNIVQKAVKSVKNVVSSFFKKK